ncbi:hypothetical protein [Hymenobacter canadensis]|uniref:Uncharacterized protein n=1 Tax=Hymenobacter canadensis TaxID=2999067 RepID=A0ABY7LVE9_9BACT|nr:hypothetical protein [Hymenobacter canadensis]WBA44353.1 hypothetical protein O3303_21340 [Hymenobacter canadensis]
MAYLLVVALSAPFLVTWGAPKPWWAKAVIFLGSYPLDLATTKEGYFLAALCINALGWGVLATGVWGLVKRLFVTRQSQAAR